MATSVDTAYCSLLKELLAEGEEIVTRNSKVKRIFSRTVRFDSTPLVSVRKTAWRNAIREWEFFMGGHTRISSMHPNIFKWWEPWVNSDGDIKYSYGKQFRRFDGKHESTDQISNFIEGIREHPYSRRNCITTWHPVEMVAADCPITNCHHTLTQAIVDSKNRLHLDTSQRSSDVICGLGANWIQTHAFHLWLCHLTGREMGSLIWNGKDIHLYEEHWDLAKQIVASYEAEYASLGTECIKTPTLMYTPSSTDFVADDFTLDGEYNPLITTTAKMII